MNKKIGYVNLFMAGLLLGAALFSSFQPIISLVFMSVNSYAAYINLK